MATATERPRLPLTERRRLTIALALAAAVELAMGAAIGAGQGKLVVLSVGAAVGALAVVRYPFAAACALLALAAGVLTEELPPIPVAGVGVYAFEPLLGLLLALAVVRPRRQTWGGPIGLALGLFLGVLTLSSLVAVQSGSVDINDVALTGRGYALLLFFWIVIRLFPERQQVERLLCAGIVIGAVSGAIALALAVGVDPGALLLEPNRAAYRSDGPGFARVRLPGLALAFSLLWVLVLLVVRGSRPRWLWVACLTGAAANILVSLNRNMWVAGTVGLMLALVLLGPFARGRIVAAGTIVVAGICLLTLVPATERVTGSVLRPVAERAQTLLQPGKVAEESSLQDRGRENRVAWAVAQDNALLGIAPGTPFGLYTTEGSGASVRPVPQMWVHNQYLYLLMITGVPGALLLVGAIAGSAMSALRDPRRRPELLMLAVALVTIMLTAIVMLSLSDGNYLLAIALVAGAIFALRHEEESA